MKSLKKGGMGKMLGSIRRRGTSGTDSGPESDNPEAIAAHSVKLFCESGGATNSGDEVLYLPPIVEAAESSPAAAAECARLIRKYCKRDFWSRPSYQYNAIMVMRILADNPGPTFTRNIDSKFVDTFKELLRNGRDPSVQQIIMETLNAFEHTKTYDEGLQPLVEMWRKEKEKATKAGARFTHGPGPQAAMMNAPQIDPQAQNFHSQNYFSRNHTNRQLPSPVELASRLEEARTSAKLLQEAVTNTPPNEVLENEFMKEFADRCTSASRSIQGYMNAQNPAPDDDTMESLIDTNEQLQTALSLHQRAMLNARKFVNANSPNEPSPDLALAAPASNGIGSSRRPSPNNAARGADLDSESDFEPPPMPPRTNGQDKGKGKGKQREYDNDAVAGPSRSHTPRAEEDPFRDPVPEPTGLGLQAGGGSSAATAPGGAGGGSNLLGDAPRLAFEPFHPGFTTTPSYAGRQDSAVGKEAMHGAAGGGSADLQKDRDDEDQDDEIYDATPQRTVGKEPIYRY